jgi:hypothetical protein
MLVLLAITFDIFAINLFSAQLADLSFGRRQVEQVMLDRPDMAEVIQREPALRQMLELHFAGECKSGRVYWDSREPRNAAADHLPTILGYPRLIRLSKYCKISPVDKCTMLVFELLNFQIDREYQLLFSSAAENRKSKDEFAILCVRLEFEARQKTRSFFTKHPLREAKLEDDPNYFLTLRESDNFAEYLSWLDGPLGPTRDPREYYRKVYDGLLPGTADKRQ